MNSRIITLVICALSCIEALAQSQTDYLLTKEQGHLFFETTICGETASVMVESGIPAFLIGQDFYERNKVNLAVDFTPAGNKRINLGGLESYEISYTANGVVLLNGSLYDGPIFVLKEFEGFRLPIQYLKSADGEHSLVLMDVPQGKMSILSQYPTVASGNRYKLSFDKDYGLPVVTANVEINGMRLKEDLVLDFGSPMLLFIMKQHKSAKRLLKKGHIQLHDAYGPNGELIAQSFYSDDTKICGKPFGECGIPVTEKMPTIKQFGLIGIPFFDTPVLFDFDKMELVSIH